METLQFKTNINCSGCVAKVTPRLNETTGIAQWNIDTNNPDKILTVQTEAASKEQVIEAVKKAGFKIEALTN
ncbi:MAG: heavy-metal-associated domain-containing protein [Chitinophagaceae bacterium]